ncbi:hypothetical protein ACFWZ2_13880 [Streptomyces sp. NPDC059002]|uniref:hypothetical protein n=1 Tax=Streptomyces sp. NPDC059002 TaxID=3346690 RepID=UPI003694B170
MTGWAGLGGLGIVVTLCPVGGVSVAAHVEALGVALSGQVEVCREDLPGAAADIAVGPAPGPAAHRAAPPRRDPPPATPPSPDRPTPEPSPEPPPRARPAPRPAPAAPRVRELLIPVRLESAPPHRRPAPAPPPSFPAPHYRGAGEPEPPAGRSVVTTTMVVTTPAVLAAALLRPRSGSRSGASSRSRSHSGGSS